MIEALKPYPAMKDSGVPWLGAVPEHWEVRRLKWVCRFAYGDALAAESRCDGDVAVCGSNGQVGCHSVPNTKAPCLVVGRKGSFGKVNFSSEPVFAIDTTFFVDATTSSANIRWLYFVLGCLRLDEVSKDSAIPGLDREEAYQQPVVCPPLPEQAAIVRFLDHADRRIRRYVRAKQKLIKLLEEQKQAIVHRAVTHGLDPNVRLKPSGVEWLGDVPEHWEVRPAKYFYREVDERSETGGEELLSVSHITGVSPRSQKNITMFMASSYVGHKVCKPGDLVINTMWAWMAALGVAWQTGIVSPSYGVYRPLRPTVLLGEYADLLLRTRPYVSEYVCRSTGIRSSRLRLYPEQFLRVRIVCPPVEEQRVILEHLSAETREMEQALAGAQREIDLLREYRTRLIADVVTGKLDVCEAAARLPEEVDEPESLDEVEAGSDVIDGGDELDEATEEAGA